MKTRWTFAMGIAAGILAGPTVQADTLHTKADSFTNQNRPTIRYGSTASLKVRNGQTTFVRFDLDALPEGVLISKAMLRMFVGSITSGGAITVHVVAAPWTEEQLTYSNQPGYGAPLSNVLTVDASAAGNYVTVDVTPAVQAWVAGEPNHGLALQGDAFVNGDFDSKENAGTSHGVELEIVPVGPAGERGPSGPTGAQGPQGEAGSTGPAGPQGATGATGPQGAQGAVGPIGPQGATGETGATGPQGPAGVQGTPGDTGAQGAQGPQGAMGPQGDAGLQGQPGATGAQGPMGPAGLPGPTGDPGAQGPAGAQGNPGAPGASGPQGAPGATGAQGDPGSAGPQGGAGAPGPQGLKGDKGDPSYQRILFVPAGPDANANGAALQDAIGRAALLGPRVSIKVEPGAFTLSQQLVVPVGVQIEGSGKKAGTFIWRRSAGTADAQEAAVVRMGNQTTIRDVEIRCETLDASHCTGISMVGVSADVRDVAISVLGSGFNIGLYAGTGSSGGVVDVFADVQNGGAVSNYGLLLENSAINLSRVLAWAQGGSEAIAIRLGNVSETTRLEDVNAVAWTATNVRGLMLEGSNIVAHNVQAEASHGANETFAILIRNSTPQIVDSRARATANAGIAAGIYSEGSAHRPHIRNSTISAYGDTNFTHFGIRSVGASMDIFNTLVEGGTFGFEFWTGPSNSVGLIRVFNSNIGSARTGIYVGGAGIFKMAGGQVRGPYSTSDTGPGGTIQCFNVVTSNDGNDMREALVNCR